MTHETSDDILKHVFSIESNYGHNRVTAYSIFDDALQTGELDYINGGMNESTRPESQIRYLNQHHRSTAFMF